MAFLSTVGMGPNEETVTNTGRLRVETRDLSILYGLRNRNKTVYALDMFY